VSATGCPTIAAIGLDLGEFALSGSPPAFDGTSEMIAPRRTVFDKLLLDAAAEAGAEVCEGFAVTGLTRTGDRVNGIRGRTKDGGEVEETARIVIGADGRNSLVAKAAGAEIYNQRPVLTCAVYAYWRDAVPHLAAIHPLEQRIVISFPTNDGLTITPVVFPRAQLPSVQADLAGHLTRSLAMVPALAEPFADAKRVERIRGTGDIPNFFRKPFGDGWALVGDAGYHKDPILAQGISDALRSAEWVAEAVDAGLSGARPMGEALADYRRTRDEHLTPMYELCVGMAALEPPSPEMTALWGALRDNPVERDRYFGTLGGTVPIPEYYAPENLRRIVGAA